MRKGHVYPMLLLLDAEVASDLHLTMDSVRYGHLWNCRYGENGMCLWAVKRSIGKHLLFCLPSTPFLPPSLPYPHGCSRSHPLCTFTENLGLSWRRVKNPGCIQPFYLYVPQVHLHYPWVLWDTTIFIINSSFCLSLFKLDFYYLYTRVLTYLIQEKLDAQKARESRDNRGQSPESRRG